MSGKYLLPFAILLANALAGCTVRVTPGKSYCYICCACVGSGSLEILDDTHFRMEYTEFMKKKQDRVTVGTGTYTQQGGILRLQFVDMPRMPSEIRLHKIAESEKLEIRVLKVIDHLSPDSVGGASLKVKSKTNSSRAYLDHYVFGGESDPLVWKPSSNKSADWILEASFMGRNATSIPLPNPGIYEAIIVMPSDYADVHLGNGEERTFKVTRYPGETVIRQKENRKIVYTTESCYCN